MYGDKRILAVIPARAGSKGLPNKNIFEIKGKPLIDYTIKEALKSKYLDRVVVSTDSEIIADVAKKCGADVPFLRSIDLAQDNSKTVDVILDLVKKLSKKNEEYDYVVLLQPTQPLRQSFHIDEAITMICEGKLESLVSVCEVEENPVLIRRITATGRLQNLLKQSSSVRRQDFPKYYKVNGAIYINKIDENLNKDTSFNDNKFPYIMEKKYDIDIDEPYDLEVFMIKLKRINNDRSFE